MSMTISLECGNKNCILKQQKTGIINIRTSFLAMNMIYCSKYEKASGAISITKTKQTSEVAIYLQLVNVQKHTRIKFSIVKLDGMMSVFS